MPAGGPNAPKLPGSVQGSVASLGSSVAFQPSSSSFSPPPASAAGSAAGSAAAGSMAAGSAAHIRPAEAARSLFLPGTRRGTRHGTALAQAQARLSPRLQSWAPRPRSMMSVGSRTAPLGVSRLPSSRPQTQLSTPKVRRPSAVGRRPPWFSGRSVERRTKVVHGGCAFLGTARWWWCGGVWCVALGSAAFYLHARVARCCCDGRKKPSACRLRTSLPAPACCRPAMLRFGDGRSLNGRFEPRVASVESASPCLFPTGTTHHSRANSWRVSFGQHLRLWTNDRSGASAGLWSASCMQTVVSQVVKEGVAPEGSQPRALCTLCTVHSPRSLLTRWYLSLSGAQCAMSMASIKLRGGVTIAKIRTADRPVTMLCRVRPPPFLFMFSWRASAGSAVRPRDQRPQACVRSRVCSSTGGSFGSDGHFVLVRCLCSGAPSLIFSDRQLACVGGALWLMGWCALAVASWHFDGRVPHQQQGRDFRFLVAEQGK